MYSETPGQNIVSSLLRNPFACPQVLVEWLSNGYQNRQQCMQYIIAL